MASADVQTLQDAYEAFNRGDIPAVLAVMDPNIEWNEPGGGRAAAGTFHGPQSVAEDVFSDVPENFEEFRAEPGASSRRSVTTSSWLDSFVPSPRPAET